MSNERSRGLRPEYGQMSMGPPHWSDWVNDILESEAVKNRFNFTRRHFISVLLLWTLLASQWRADGAQLVNASLLHRTQLTNTSALDRAQLINTSALNLTLPPGLNLNDQDKTVKNFAVPLPVYVATPLATVFISIGAIWAFWSWRLKLVRRRKMLLERAQLRRRRSSLKPGSSERGKKFGLTRAVGPDGDPLIIPTAKVLDLARKLDDVEQLVLDYQSYNMGDHLPEKQEYKVKEVKYNISINPFFNSLQSGACGYVLSGDGKLAAAQPGDKMMKPDDGSGDDSDSDGGPKKESSVVLHKLSVSKRAPSAIASPPRLSRLSVETKSKEDTLGRSLAKSIIKEAQQEEESSAEESSDDASYVDSDSADTSSVEYLDTRRGPSKKSTLQDELSARSSLRSFKLAASAEDSGADSDNELASPKSLASSRLSKVSPAADSPPEHSKFAVSEGETAVSGEDSPRAAVSGEDSPSAGSGEDSPRASLSSKTSKTSDSVKDSPKVGVTHPDQNSPLASLSPRSSKSAVSEKDLESSLFASPSRKSTKGSVSPRFSDVTTSDTDREKPAWNPRTVPERSSIKKSVASGSISRGSKSQGASPDEPSSPTERVARPSREGTASSSEPASPKKSVSKAVAEAGSSKESSLKK